MKVAIQYSSIKDRKSAIYRALEDVGLKGLEKQKVFTLSGGEQQRLAMARLLVKPCRLILADEPTGNLDEANAKHIVRIFRSFIDQGKSVVVVTHAKELLPSFNRVITLS